jgi:hypothetical protein
MFRMERTKYLYTRYITINSIKLKHWKLYSIFNSTLILSSNLCLLDRNYTIHNLRKETVNIDKVFENFFKAHQIWKLLKLKIEKDMDRMIQLWIWNFNVMQAINIVFEIHIIQYFIFRPNSRLRFMPKAIINSKYSQYKRILYFLNTNRIFSRE